MYVEMSSMVHYLYVVIMCFEMLALDHIQFHHAYNKGELCYKSLISFISLCIFERYMYVVINYQKGGD